MHKKFMIGLEAEYLLRDKKGKLVFPNSYGFPTDDFSILGEMRGKPGATRAETVGNFMQEIAGVLFHSKKQGLAVDFSGVAEISPEFKSEILRDMGSKEFPMCENIYKIDISKFSDDVVDRKGRIVRSFVSAGLHVHFSISAVAEFTSKKGKTSVQELSILTREQRNFIIRKMDKILLPKYQPKLRLKYRQPGFYEMKPWGFEYRSLPMIPRFTSIEGIMEVVDFAFTQLESFSN